MKVNSIALEAMARTLLGQYQKRAPYASVQDLTDIVVLLLRNPEGIFLARIQPDPELYRDYTDWHRVVEENRATQYELV